MNQKKRDFKEYMGLFSTTIETTNNTTTLVPYVKTEIKAPTDESIRLLNEFKEKILKDTMTVFEVRNDSFNFVARLVENPADMSKMAVIKFSINGEEITKEIEIDPFRNSLNTSKEEVIKFFIESYKKMLTDIIGENLIKYTLTDLFRK